MYTVEAHVNCDVRCYIKADSADEAEEKYRNGEIEKTEIVEMFSTVEIYWVDIVPEGNE